MGGGASFTLCPLKSSFYGGVTSASFSTGAAAKALSTITGTELSVLMSQLRLKDFIRTSVTHNRKPTRTTGWLFSAAFTNHGGSVNHRMKHYGKNSWRAGGRSGSRVWSLQSSSVPLVCWFLILQFQRGHPIISPCGSREEPPSGSRKQRASWHSARGPQPGASPVSTFTPVRFWLETCRVFP